jgi:hypothetical protein
MAGSAVLDLVKKIRQLVKDRQAGWEVAFFQMYINMGLWLCLTIIRKQLKEL